MNIHITRWGTAGPRVVLVHGGAQGGAGGERSFSAQERLAERGWQVIVPDLSDEFNQVPAAFMK